MRQLLTFLTLSAPLVTSSEEAKADESFKMNKRYNCATELDGSGSFFAFKEDSYPRNREHLLDQCEEHAGNTCCLMKHIDQLTAKLNVIKSQNTF